MLRFNAPFDMTEMRTLRGIVDPRRADKIFYPRCMTARHISRRP